MNLQQFQDLLAQSPEAIDFNGVITLIDSLYEFTPTTFTNGQQVNTAGENSGSCKIFAFAKKQALNEQQTLLCFGQYYRDVLAEPDGDSHQNIRNFMQTGWQGISFETEPLTNRV